MKTSILLASIVFSLPVLSVADVPGVTEPPVLKRMTGSDVTYFKSNKFDELNLPLEKIVFDYSTTKFKNTKKLHVEGPLTTLYYRIPGDASTLEVIRQYEADLAPAGFENIFVGPSNDIDDGFNRFVTETFPLAKEDPMIGQFHEFNSKDHRYALLKGKNAAGGDVYVSVYAFKFDDVGMGTGKMAAENKFQKGESGVRIDYLETKRMDLRMAVVKAQEIEDTITAAGKIAIYGVFFDTDKAIIKPESAESLQEMAKAINAAPADKKFLIVGHTDNQGALDYNQKLSSSRASAVVAELASKYNVPATKIIAVGVGMAAPVSTNSDEAGRSKNRRVEIVAM